MKASIPLRAPEGVDFPPYLPWVFSSILLPCPLYIITTVDEAGVPNAQANSWGLPYGAGDMQMFLFSCETTHHTFENALATREFVVNVPSVDVSTQVMRTARHYPRGVDEIKASGLTPLPSRSVAAPGIAECKAHLECTVLWHHVVTLSEGHGCAVIAGKIVAAIGGCRRLGRRRGAQTHYDGDAVAGQPERRCAHLGRLRSPNVRDYVDSGGLLGDDARDGRRATQGLEPGCQ